MKEKISTKELIVNKAIEVFNEHGLEYFGIRELAKALNIKAGNITYYFPTKNDLVAEIANRCTEAGTGIFTLKDNLTAYDFLRMLKEAFQNQYHYRSLLLSLPHIVREIEDINVHYKESQIHRRAFFNKVLDMLHQSGSLQEVSDPVRRHFVQFMIMVMRFWISDYSVNESLHFEKNHVFHHIEGVAGFLEYFATPKGLEEIHRFQEELHSQKHFETI